MPLPRGRQHYTCAPCVHYIHIPNYGDDCRYILSAAFPCNRTKQPARTLRASFALVALSRRPWLWPVTVRRRLNSGRPAYSPTTSYFIFISILHMSKADSYKRQRGRPKPGPTAQNKPSELDPKGSHGLLCAHLRRKHGKSVGGPRLLRGTSDGNAGKVSEVSRKKKGPPTVLWCFCRRSLMLLPAS